MKVKRYVANSMPDAMARIRDDLGEQAIILDSKPIKQPGVLGPLFGKRRFEVIAAVERLPKEQSAASPPVEKDIHNDGLRQEVQSIKRMMEKWMNDQSTSDLPPSFAAVETALRKQQVADDVSASVVQAVRAHVDDIREVDEKVVRALAAEEIKRRFARIVELPAEREMIYFIGPTGVGKTTTIAKIAANYVLEKGLRVGLIAADTYRIAAVEQLKTYASILNVPIEVVHDPNDMEAAKQKLSGCDVVLVDTAGRNYRQKMKVSELFAYVQSDHAAVHLVLSLTMRDEDIEAVLGNFSAWPVTHLLLTKADETTSCGLALNLACKTDYKLSFITTGQNVPDDIMLADADKLTDWVLGVERFA